MSFNIPSGIAGAVGCIPLTNGPGLDGAGMIFFRGYHIFPSIYRIYCSDGVSVCDYEFFLIRN